jgi:hypothetical protein
MNRYHACIILAACLLTFGGRPALGQDLRTPLSAVIPGGSREGVDSFIASKLVAPAEGWRLRALASSEKRSASASEDLDLVIDGIRFKHGDRNLLDEYLSVMPDERLKRLYEQGRKSSGRIYEILMCRKRIADAILQRQGLVALHPEARFESALMAFMTSETFEEGLALFDEQKGFSGEYVERAAAVRRVLTGPESGRDYAESIKLMEIAEQYNARLQRLWLSSPLMKQVVGNGPEHFAPSRFSGETAPIIAASMASFEYSRSDELDGLVSLAERTQSFPQEALITVRYWAGMNAYAVGDYGRAQSLFQRNVDTQSDAKLAAYSSCRLGDTYMLKKDWLQAAVVFMMTEEDFLGVPEAADWAHRKKEFLFDSGLLDRVVFQSQADALRKQRLVSMQTSQN